MKLMANGIWQLNNSANFNITQVDKINNLKAKLNKAKNLPGYFERTSEWDRYTKYILLIEDIHLFHPPYVC